MFSCAMLGVDVKALGKRVKDARLRAGMTQAGLAEAASVADETVSRIERGAYEPTVSTLCALADALGVNIEHLAGRTGSTRPTRRTLLMRLRPLIAAAERLDQADLRLIAALADRLARRRTRTTGPGRATRGDG